MNRVYCLYRVSTVQQLHEDDIPMQRQACREFAAARGWKVIKEFYEKGISGFKTPTADRRVLQQIKKDVKQHEFDILLVFMSAFCNVLFSLRDIFSAMYLRHNLSDALLDA